MSKFIKALFKANIEPTRQHENPQDELADQILKGYEWKAKLFWKFRFPILIGSGLLFLTGLGLAIDMLVSMYTH